MSNLAIVFCAAVFFGSVSSVVTFEDSVETIQLEAQKALNLTIHEFESRFKVIHEANEKKSSNLSRQAIEVNNKIMEEQWGIISEIAFALTKDAEDIDDDIISDCNKYFEHLMKTAEAVHVTTETCIDNKLKIGYDYIANIDKHFKSEIMRLMEIRSDIGRCTDNIYHTNTATTAMSCINAAQDKVTAICDRFDIILERETVGLDFFLATLDLNIIDCVDKNGLADFRRESLTIVENTKKCIQEKIDGYYTSISPR